MKVILDLVLNHVSDQHPWFLASATKVKGSEDAFIWRDTRPDGWGQAWSNQPNPEAVWHWNEQRRGYYYGAFGNSQPDLNLRNSAIVNELDAVAAFWLKKCATRSRTARWRSRPTPRPPSITGPHSRRR
jgi:glycosidase